MVQTWNKFCFTSGYIEVSVTFPGPDENTAGYVSSLSSLSALQRDTNPGIPALILGDDMSPSFLSASIRDVTY